MLGVYYLCVKNVGSMCGQCRSLSGLCGGQKNVFFNDSFFKFLFHSHVVVSVVFSKLVIEIEEKAHLIRNNVFVI